MTQEQKLENELLQYIMTRSMMEAEIEFEGRKYNSYIFKDNDKEPMRIIFGERGWTICPIRISIDECIKMFRI